MTPATPSFLRRLAALLVRGPEAPYVLGDLDDAFDRDVARGLPLWRVRWRFGVNIVSSAVSVTVARLRTSSIAMSWIDVKLGLRMLVKYPTLTAVALFALTIGLPVALAPIHLVSATEGHLPEDPEGRLQLLRYWRVETTTEDLARWRVSLRSFERLGGVHSSVYNIASDHADGTTSGAEVTASALEMLGVSPMLGRSFTSADEVPGAPAVVLIGHELWQRLFERSRSVVGQTLRIGNVPHEVIGVMPEGFEFPARQRLWLPVRTSPAVVRENARPISIIGRLARGVTPEAAQLELTAVASQASTPDEDALIPEVVPTSFLFFGFPKGGLRATPDFFVARILTVVPLLIACVNVGLLIFARTATRASEFAVRTALGASRSRILTQVFTESLVLALLATGLGLLLLGWLPGQVLSTFGIALPYWVDTGMTTTTAIRALALGVCSALLAGVVPVLRTTGQSITRTIQRAHAQRSGVRFGGLTSVLIVADVAVAVAVVGFSAAIAGRATATMANETGDGIQADRYLSFELRRPSGIDSTIDSTGPQIGDQQHIDAHMAATQLALVDRLLSEPGVRAVAVGSALPRMDHTLRRIELAEGDQRLYRAVTATVAPDFFSELGHPILTGRAFDARDLAPDARSVIVNTSFVSRVLEGANPIGRRVRYLAWDDASPPGPWYEIVGVVGHLGMHSLNPDQDEGIYRPLVPGSLQPVRIGIELGPNPLEFAPRLRELVADIDPQAVISGIKSLDRAFEGDWYVMTAVVVGGLILVGVLLTLAASGIYAIMSFTVAQRTREIGIRMALGADRSEIVATVAKRALVQIGIGVSLGMVIGGRIFYELQRDSYPDGSPVVAIVLSLLPGVAIMAAVGLVACAAPTLRALRISPVDALRGDG